MRLRPDSGASTSRRLALLGPSGVPTAGFRNVNVDPALHRSLLENMQRFRGKVYLDIHAVAASELSADGRHVQHADADAWHVLTLEQGGEVSGCARFLMHAEAVTYSELSVSDSALAKSSAWGKRLRLAVEAELAAAKRQRLKFVELGGWAIAAASRCTTEAARMLLATYALSRWFGGAIAISTANLSCSAPVLRRIGGRPMMAQGIELPSYFEPKYNCELEVLRFDSSSPNPKYASWIDDIQASLFSIQVIAA